MTPDAGQNTPPPRAFSLEHLRQLADTLDHGVVMLSPQAVVRLWNRWLGDRTGIQPAAALGRKIHDLFPGLGASGFAEEFKRSVAREGKGFLWNRQCGEEFLRQFESACGLSPPGLEQLVCRCASQGEGLSAWIELVPRTALAGNEPGQKGAIPAAATPAARAASPTFDAGLASDRLGIMAVDSGGSIIRVNQAILDITGFEQSDLVGKPLRVLFPDIADGVAEESCRTNIDSLRRRHPEGYLEAVSVDGSTVKFDVWLFDSAAAKDQLILCCQDVSRVSGLQDAMHRQREFLSAIYTEVADGILLLDHRGYLDNINPVASEMLGLGHRRHGNAHVDDVLRLKGDDGGRVYPFAEAMNRERTVNIIDGVELSLPGGAGIPVMVSATPIRDRSNQIAGCVVVMRAVSESRRISSRLSWNETHDPLTQLANRRQMENEVVRAIDNVHVEDTTHGLLYIDLFNFSMINDTCGHAAGDELLRQFGRLLSQAVGNHDVVGRTGNDEFALLLWDRSPDQVGLEAEHILNLVNGFSLPWEDRRLKLGASIGVEMINRNSTSEVDVLLAARASCAIARESGRNRIHFPRKNRDVKLRHNLSSMAASIGEALDENRFVVYCQPIVPLQGRKEARHYEALVRMVDREGRIMPPGKFIPAAEASGFIDDIDKWVFEKVLSSLEGLPPEKRKNYAISVNLSGNTISDERFLDHVARRLKEACLDPGVLLFEITETAAVKHFDRAVRFIETLTELGCTFALDDFGSGLSSFGYLKRLPVSYLKIDGSFVRKMEVDDVEYSMVSTINHLAHIMGLLTIAEGVENQTQMSILQDMGVDYGQGFFFAVPEPLDKIL